MPSELRQHDHETRETLMGDWGSGPFENDAACDLLSDVADGGGFRTIRAVFARILMGHQAENPDPLACSLDRLWGSEWQEAVAAAELVAVAAGAPTSDLPEEALAWLQGASRRSARRLLPLARAIVERALTDSELRSINTDAHGIVDSGWEGSVRDLQMRLEGLAKGRVDLARSGQHSRRVRLRVGDVFAMRLADGLVRYGQYLHEHEREGSLVQVFRAATPEVLPVEEVIGTGALFPPVYVGLRPAIREGRWHVIGRAPVEGFVHPLFRDHSNPSPGKNSPSWWIWDGTTETRIGELPSEYRALEMRGSWGYELLENRILKGRSVYDDMW